jgi:hypothetical protein
LTPRFLCFNFVTNIIWAIAVFNFNVTCFAIITFGERSRDWVVGMATPLQTRWLRNCCAMERRNISAPENPDRLWALPRLLFHA